MLKNEISSGQFGEMAQERPGLKVRWVRNRRASGPHTRSRFGEGFFILNGRSMPFIGRQQCFPLFSGVESLAVLSSTWTPGSRPCWSELVDEKRSDRTPLGVMQGRHLTVAKMTALYPAGRLRHGKKSFYNDSRSLREEIRTNDILFTYS
jgi:hypothetical protein